MMRILALGLTLTAAPLAIADSLPAQTLLERMTEATQELDYQGRFLYQQGGEVSTKEIRHPVIDGEQYQRFTHLDGRLVEVLRLGDELVCLHPNGTLTRIDDPDQNLLSFRQRLSSRIPEQYNVLVDGDGRVAGRATTRMRVAPLDVRLRASGESEHEPRLKHAVKRPLVAKRYWLHISPSDSSTW